MNVKEEIRKLIDLQAIDSQLFNLKKERDGEKPEKIREIKEDFESEKSILSSLEEETKRTQLKKKEKELDLETKEESTRKAQVQLYQLKTNQEYKAKLKEIESLKADTSIIEEDIIKILEESDEKSQKLAEKKKLIAEKEKESNLKIKQIEEEIKELDAKIKNLQDKRNILAKKVDPNVLKRYEHLLKNRNGLALVPLKDGSCGGCFMNLPPEMTNKIKQYKEIIQCEMCARMVYLAEDFS